MTRASAIILICLCAPSCEKKEPSFDTPDGPGDTGAASMDDPPARRDALAPPVPVDSSALDASPFDASPAPTQGHFHGSASRLRKTIDFADLVSRGACQKASK